MTKPTSEPARRPVPPLEGTPGHVPDITTRFAMGVFLIALAALAIWFGGWPFRALVLLGAGIMLAEWAEMHRVSWLWTWLGVALLAVLLLGGVQYFYSVGQADTVSLGFGEQMLTISPETFEPLVYLGGAAAVLGLLLALLARRPTLGWGFVYIALPALALLALSWVDYALVFWVMIVTWSTDIGAFFAGKGLGGPKLAPRISPAKTWAGLVGGAIAAGLIGYVAARYFEIDTAPDAVTGEVSWLYQSFLYLGAPLAVVAQAGDLYESWVKRRCGVKDSGTILPGHGGVLDRCDGLIAVSFATLLILIVGLWLG
ncbi:MAG TPA: phosphatidate cytidylyltransferase [Allosphingosinicella sp.]|nr:phosphatidate cytidylyltransferase [Allosphingosinicella sp.]